MNNINNYLLESEVDYQRNLEGKFRYNLDPPRNKPQRGHQLAGNSSKLFPHSPSHYYLQDQILWRTNLLLIAGSDPNKENMNQGFKIASGRGQGLVYIGQSINSGPSDQTDLKERRRCNLGGDEGGLKVGSLGRTACRWGQPAPHAILSWSPSVVCLLESSRVFPRWFHYE